MTTVILPANPSTSIRVKEGKLPSKIPTAIITVTGGTVQHDLRFIHTDEGSLGVKVSNEEGKKGGVIGIRSKDRDFMIYRACTRVVPITLDTSKIHLDPKKVVTKKITIKIDGSMLFLFVAPLPVTEKTRDTSPSGRLVKKNVKEEKREEKKDEKKEKGDKKDASQKKNKEEGESEKKMKAK